jgi:dienelactone hydrolase
MSLRRRPPAARIALLVALVATGATFAQSPAAVADFAAGPPSGRYAFASSTPRSLAELFEGSAPRDVKVVGHLFLPPGDGKVPAVVLVHGSGGMYSALLDYWPRRLNAAGYAVFAIDMFGPRGVRSTVADQTLVPFTSDLADAFAALRLLATHPRIDAKRIAIMGFSRGGAAAWRTSVERIIAAQKLPGGLRYAAHVPVYSGGCTGILRLVVKPGTFAKEPILFIHGDADDMTPIAPCRDYADRIAKAGTPVGFVVIPGAHHKFDDEDLRRHFVRDALRSRPDCVLEFDIDTSYAYDRTNGARLQGDAYREAVRSCNATGANVEGNHAARDKAADAAIAFLRKNLAR